MSRPASTSVLTVVTNSSRSACVWVATLCRGSGWCTKADTHRDAASSGDLREDHLLENRTSNVHDSPHLLVRGLALDDLRHGDQERAILTGGRYRTGVRAPPLAFPVREMTSDTACRAARQPRVLRGSPRQPVVGAEPRRRSEPVQAPCRLGSSCRRSQRSLMRVMISVTSPHCARSTLATSAVRSFWSRSDNSLGARTSCAFQACFPCGDVTADHETGPREPPVRQRSASTSPGGPLCRTPAMAGQLGSTRPRSDARARFRGVATPNPCLGSKMSMAHDGITLVKEDLPW